MQDVIQETGASLIAKAYRTKKILQHTSSDSNASELNSRASSESNANENTAQATSWNTNSSEINSRSVIESEENISLDASNSVQTESMSPSFRSSNISETRNESESRNDVPCYAEDIRHGQRQQSSKEYQRQYSPYSYDRSKYRMGGWRQGGEIPNHPRKNAFETPKAPVEIRMEASRRIQEALNEVPDAVHFNANSTRTAITLFVGNLDFKARAIDLMRSLRTYFYGRIHIDEIDIPNYNDQHRGYGFSTLSWVRMAHVDPADICKALSGMIQVKSRRVYFQELHSDVAYKDST
jgi:hypothetical protein